jgi:xanthine/uracil permease
MQGGSEPRHLYGVEDRPRLTPVIALSVQHALLALVFLVYPLAAALQIGLTPGDTEKFLTAVILSIGGATFLHGFRRPLGTGVLAVEIPTPAFLPTAVLAGGAGGLSMLAGMSLVSGIVELLFAGSLRRLRALFPAEVCGVAVVMLGLSLVRPGILSILSPGAGPPVISAGSLAVAVLTLATITTLAIFATGRLKLLALGGGLLAGIGLASLIGMTSGSYWDPVLQSAWVGMPALDIGMARFSLELLPLCVVMALILGIDNVGMLIGIQRQIDPAWSRIDLRQASSGIRVSAVGDLIAGVLGGMPTGISSANISLAHATGAIARRISHFTGVLLLAAAFSPKAVKAVALIPKPVVGAVMLYAAAYMLVSGMTLFLGRLLNERRMFVVGFSIVLGLGPVVVPNLFGQASALLRPILESPLALGSFCAILLTQLLRIGAAAKTRIGIVLPDSNNEMVQELVCNKTIRAGLVKLGATAGAARPAVYRAIDVTSEWVGWLKVKGFIEGDIQLTASFIDSRLDITLDYDGRPAPTAGERPLAEVDYCTIHGNGLRQHLTLGFEPAN